MNTIRQQLISTAPSILSRFPVLFAYLYGSHATETAHSFSDIDIGIFLSKKAIDRTMEIESNIALAMDAALGHKAETDVRTINDLPLIMKGEIISEGILIYTRNEAARVEFETRVRMSYFDFLPVIKAYHAAYIKNLLPGH